MSGGSVSGASARPAKPPAADQPAIDMDGIRPSEWLSAAPAARARQRITKRNHAGVERPPRHSQRLFGLEHDGELRQIEAPDVHQRARTLFGCNGFGMREGIAHLPEPHQAEGRRQIERRTSVLARHGVRIAASLNSLSSRFLFRIIII